MNKTAIDNNEIRRLLRRYYDGETTREEESSLREAALSGSITDKAIAQELGVYLSLSEQLDDMADILVESAPADLLPTDLFAESAPAAEKKRRHGFRWPIWVAAAACVALLIGVGVSLMPGDEKSAPSASAPLTATAEDSSQESETAPLVPTLQPKEHMAKVAHSGTTVRKGTVPEKRTAQRVGKREPAQARTKPEQSLQEMRRLLNRDMGGEEYKPLVCLNDCDDMSPRTIADVAAEGTSRVSQEMDRLYNSAEMSVQRVAYDFQAP